MVWAVGWTQSIAMEEYEDRGPVPTWWTRLPPDETLGRIAAGLVAWHELLVELELRLGSTCLSTWVLRPPSQIPRTFGWDQLRARRHGYRPRWMQAATSWAAHQMIRHGVSVGVVAVRYQDGPGRARQHPRVNP